MAAKEVKAKNPKTNAETTVMYDFGENLQDAVTKFGENVVFEKFVAQSTVNLQSGLRTCLEQGKDPEAYAAAWKPGVKAPSIAADPLSAAKAAFTRMTTEEKEAFLASL